MIIGNGLIASLFKDSDKENIIFFASGVSNSLETRKQEFSREENLLRKTIENFPNKIFLYFSTCSIYDSSKTESNYVLHKLKMEQLIKNSVKDYLILRVSNAVGKSGNPNLLMNYFIQSIRHNETINVHTKASRNLIDTEDIKNITLELLNQNKTNRIINIAYLHSYSIIEILEIIENFYNIKLNLNLVKKGSGFDIEIHDVENYFHTRQLTNKEDYLRRILKKYY